MVQQKSSLTSSEIRSTLSITIRRRLEKDLLEKDLKIWNVICKDAVVTQEELVQLLQVFCT